MYEYMNIYICTYLCLVPGVDEWFGDSTDDLTNDWSIRITSGRMVGRFDGRLDELLDHSDNKWTNGWTIRRTIGRMIGPFE